MGRWLAIIAQLSSGGPSFPKMKLLFAAVLALLACSALGDFKKDVVRVHRTLRKKHGLKKLKWDNTLAQHAQVCGT